MLQHKITTLKNGLRLVTVPMPHVESATIMIAVGAGSRNEAKPVNGLFHFLEHMAFKGTKKRPTALDIASEIDEVGGQFNAYTDKEMTTYYIKLASKHTELAFDILSDMLQNSLFDEREIDKEKGVIIEEINMYEDLLMRRALVDFINLLYGDNPMGWDVLGEGKTIRGIKREDFLNFQDKLYFPKNMVVVVTGEVNDRKLKTLTYNYLGDFEKKGKKVSKSIKPSQESARVNLRSKKTEQAHFCLGVPGYSYTHKRRFPAGVLSVILGGGMSSRLSSEIREKRGLAYYVSTSPEFFTDSGFVLTRSGVRLDKVDEAIKIVLDEYENLAKIKVSQKELSKAKEYLKGNMILTLEDSQKVAERYSNQALLEEKLRTPQETIRLIDKVTTEDVQEVASEIFKPEKLNLAIIGPYKDENRFRKLLK